MDVSDLEQLPGRMRIADVLFWMPYLRLDIGQDEMGFVYGYCPLHQSDMHGACDNPELMMSGATPQAKFSFTKGNWTCLGEESCLAPKRAGTINNLRNLIDGIAARLH